VRLVGVVGRPLDEKVAVNGAEVGDWSEGWAFTAPGLSPPGFELYLPVVARGYPLE
jgi:hypothetical protein